MPGPEAASHDDVFLTGLDGGWAEVGNPALEVAFRLEWDPGVFGWIISWQAFGGARAMPLRGAYALGIEPWAAGGNLEHAVAAGNALRLAGHAQLETQLTASIRPLWRGRAHCAVKPPSTTRLCPVIQALSSDSRNTAGPAMSSGCPIRRSGSRAAIVST